MLMEEKSAGADYSKTFLAFLFYIMTFTEDWNVLKKN